MALLLRDGRRILPPRFALSITLLCVTAPSCVIPFGFPPIKMDIGGARAVRPMDRNVVHAAIGVHSASIGSPDPQQDRYDVGIGYVVDSQAGVVRSQGAYAEGGWFISRSNHSRLSLGGRADLLFASDGAGGGLFGRAAGEFFTPVAGASESSVPCNHTWYALRGTPAIGTYLDAGVQLLPGGGRAFMATGGVTFRLPAFGLLALVIPGCH